MASLNRSTAARLGIILTLALAACEPVPTALRFGTDQVVLHAVLVAGAPEVSLVLSRMQPGVTPGGGTASMPLHGAVARLSAGSDTFTLTQQETPAACYRFHWLPAGDPAGNCHAAAVPGGVRPGVRYQLRVSLLDGRIVTGAATVPAAVDVLEPGPDSTVDVRHIQALQVAAAPVRVSWQPAPSWQRIELIIVPASRECAVLLPVAAQLVRRLEVSGTTAADVAPVVSCADGAWPQWLPADIVIAVYDDNYSRYAAQPTHVRSVGSVAASAGIAGAYGVFGAVALADRPVLLRLP